MFPKNVYFHSNGSVAELYNLLGIQLLLTATAAMPEPTDAMSPSTSPSDETPPLHFSQPMRLSKDDDEVSFSSMLEEEEEDVFEDKEDMFEDKVDMFEDEVEDEDEEDEVEDFEEEEEEEETLLVPEKRQRQPDSPTSTSERNAGDVHADMVHQMKRFRSSRTLVQDGFYSKENVRQQVTAKKRIPVRRPLALSQVESAREERRKSPSSNTPSQLERNILKILRQKKIARQNKGRVRSKSPIVLASATPTQRSPGSNPVPIKTPTPNTSSTPVEVVPETPMHLLNRHYPSRTPPGSTLSTSTSAPNRHRVRRDKL